MRARELSDPPRAALPPPRLRGCGNGGDGGCNGSSGRTDLGEQLAHAALLRQQLALVREQLCDGGGGGRAGRRWTAPRCCAGAGPTSSGPARRYHRAPPQSADPRAGTHRLPACTCPRCRSASPRPRTWRCTGAGSESAACERCGHAAVSARACTGRTAISSAGRCRLEWRTDPISTTPTHPRHRRAQLTQVDVPLGCRTGSGSGSRCGGRTGGALLVRLARGRSRRLLRVRRRLVSLARRLGRRLLGGRLRRRDLDLHRLSVIDCLARRASRTRRRRRRGVSITGRRLGCWSRRGRLLGLRLRRRHRGRVGRRRRRWPSRRRASRVRLVVRARGAPLLARHPGVGLRWRSWAPGGGSTRDATRNRRD